MDRVFVTSEGVSIRARPVPPYMQVQVRQSLPRPQVPQVKIASKVGSQEVHDALPGTAEFEQYRQAVDQHAQMVNDAMTAFMLDYSVVEWKEPSSEKWHSTPPEEWAPRLPPMMVQLGAKQPETEAELRVAYIKMVLIPTEEDSALLDEVMFAQRALTKEEILAALDPFALHEPVSLFELVGRIRI